jgi:type II secretory pathway component GspD/PulD (secretin)
MFSLWRLTAIMVALGVHLYPAHGEAVSPYRDPVVIRVVPLKHARAEYLASIIRPLLPKDGSVIAYGPANMLIIKGRRSLVGELIQVIKGPGRIEEPLLDCQDDPPESDGIAP